MKLNAKSLPENWRYTKSKDRAREREEGHFLWYWINPWSTTSFDPYNTPAKENRAFLIIPNFFTDEQIDVEKKISNFSKLTKQSGWARWTSNSTCRDLLLESYHLWHYLAILYSAPTAYSLLLDLLFWHIDSGERSCSCWWLSQLGKAGIPRFLQESQWKTEVLSNKLFIVLWALTRCLVRWYKVKTINPHPGSSPWSQRNQTDQKTA